MPSPVSTSPSAPPTERPLSVTFVAIVLVEVCTVAGLYWFGRYFS